MATKTELEQTLQTLKDSYDNVPIEFKDDIQREIDEVEAELDKLNAQPNATQDDNFMEQLLATMSSVMKNEGENGVDSSRVVEIIEKYLREDKVKLSELDKSVMDEIKKNQLLTLNIPNYAQDLEVDKTTAQIPNFYEIIDDVVAGNNVYLIGEAGGGKTYTAEAICKVLKKDYVTLNCSQYTSPLEILGGQSVEGFKQGKLIDCWRNGKILIMDEMPKLDPNTAGLFNDALAKSSKTRAKDDAKINSASADEPPIARADGFGIIATGNIYPNEPPASQYKGNNQQDLSLLDRFSGSVYYTEFSKITDQKTTRFEFLYNFLIGNYYEYIDAKSSGQTPPPPLGLRTIIEANNLKNMALVSYRTNTSFRVAFEYELVRAIAKKQNKLMDIIGKTLAGTFKSYMVAFRNSSVATNTIMTVSGYNEVYINNLVEDEINKIISSKTGWVKSLNDPLRQNANDYFTTYEDFYALKVNVVTKSNVAP